MKFYTTDNDKLNGTIYNKDGTPILILNEAEGEIDFEIGYITIKINTEKESSQEVLQTLSEKI